MVEANLEKILERIGAAARSVGRSASSVKLIGITKGICAERIQEAIACGVCEIGENRIQETQQKRPLIKGSVRWHLVGHLQRNKVKFAVELFDVIHSVDSLELIQALDRQAGQRADILRGAVHPSASAQDEWRAQDERRLEVLIQVNVSGEATKHGCRPQEVETLARAVLGSGNLRLLGLMTMAPEAKNPETVRPIFRQVKRLGEFLGLRELSMGMSQDFEVAVQEGATMVRIGTAIFKE